MQKRETIEVAGRELSVSNLDKVYYPDSGFTKGEVLRYYAEVGEVLLPHLRRRPLTMKRFPEGIVGEFFYEKNAPKHTPAWVKTVAVPKSGEDRDIRYILCNDLPTLLWVTNLGDIEKHVLLAEAPRLDCPKSIVFDLDPGEGADILDCGRVALHLRNLLSSLKLESWVKVSGSKGLHLAVPLNTKTSYATTQPFAKAIAELLVEQMPKLAVSNMAKSARRGKVLIDWSQNSDFKTTVAVYAMRAKPGGPQVSLPVEWEELAAAVKRKTANRLRFTPDAALKRIGKVGDLFEPVLSLKQRIPGEFAKALADGPPRKLARWPRERKNDHSLREYAAKRDHSATPEPAARPRAGNGRGRGKNAALTFVIQKHDASRLHYDWRLEMEGVLRSWAVPKGPPLNAKEARLAMHVEDHPMEYADFEGIIPDGNYGAGTVMVWDRGTYEDISGDAAAAFLQGKMHVVMHGEKLRGEWILVRDRREGDDGNKWLLIKAGETLKLTKKADDTSVASGRSMKRIASEKNRVWNSEAKTASGLGEKASEPEFLEPMMCKAVEELPSGDGWTYEIKFDGYRCVVVKNGARVRLLSRSGKSLNRRFPSLVNVFKELSEDFAMDGEVVAVDDTGRPSFQALQNSGTQRTAIRYYAFDLLNRNGRDLTGAPIEERRSEMESLLDGLENPVRMSPLLEGDPGRVIEAVEKLGLEGVIAKKAGSFYESGKRSGAWVKCHVDSQQEFVIGGYVPGSRGFHSLLVGVYAEGKLHYVAKIKDGFVPRVRDAIYPMLKPLRIDECPFGNLPEKRSRWGYAITADKMGECRWLKPKLVCQVGFTEWTKDGKLRRCRFIGMRDDKPPRKVVRER